MASDRAAAPVYGPLRMTVPVREALAQAGNIVRASEPTADGQHQWEVTLTRPVPVVLCLIGHGGSQHRGLRLADEPRYLQEWNDSAIAWHERGDWIGCPKCGGALVWYEAGYVPGYRLCTRGHHALLSADGRAAKLVHRRTM